MTVELLDVFEIDKSWIDCIKVEGDCWVWTGLIDRANGYGLIREGSRTFLAYRYIYEATIGVPPPGLRMKQLCGNRACVNPNHVEIDTVSDYIRKRYGEQESDNEIE